MVQEDALNQFQSPIKQSTLGKKQALPQNTQSRESLHLNLAEPNLSIVDDNSDNQSCTADIAVNCETRRVANNNYRLDVEMP
jgi:hypothetical protein